MSNLSQRRKSVKETSLQSIWLKNLNRREILQLKPSQSRQHIVKIKVNNVWSKK
jgi:hypothetical protein